jgi:hypothetical protein
LFTFTDPIEITGAALAGTVFVVDERPGGRADPPPDLSSLDPSDLNVQRSCATLEQALIQLSNLTETGARGLAAEMTQVTDDLDGLASSAPAAMQSDLQQLTSQLDGLATAIGELDSASVSSDEQRATNDALVAAVPFYLRTVASREGLAGPYPSLVVACELRSNGLDAANDMIVFSDALNAFLASDNADAPEFETLAQLADVTDHTRRGRTAMSTFVSAFNDCRGEPDAETYGDNPGCDRLHDACETGDLLACNDVYYSSPLRSGYETFGYFCGDRLTVGQQSNAFGGYCELL